MRKGTHTPAASRLLLLLLVCAGSPASSVGGTSGEGDVPMEEDRWRKPPHRKEPLDDLHLLRRAQERNRPPPATPASHAAGSMRGRGRGWYCAHSG